MNALAQPAVSFTSPLESEGSLMVNATSFRNAMCRLGAAVNVITTNGEAGRAGFTATAVCSVSDEPPTVLICVNRNSQAGAAIRSNGVVCVNVLRADDNPIADMFSGRAGIWGEERFDCGDWTTLATGAPVLQSALVALDCRVSEIKDVGSHCLCLASVEAIHQGEEGSALMYFQRRYGALLAAA